jgi:hypothetical protein
MTTYFPAAREDAMDADELAVLGQLRALLDQLRPPSIAPERCWVRPDRNGMDFVVPHRYLDGFAVVVAVIQDDVVVYYAFYEREDRGDDFDLSMAKSPSAKLDRTQPKWSAAMSDAVEEWLRRSLVLERSAHTRASRRDVVRVGTQGAGDGDFLWRGNADAFIAGRTPENAGTWRFSFLD